MNALTFEETNLLCIYNPGTRQGAIEALTEMRGHLQADEDELLALTDSTLAKLRAMTDAEFDELELYPDFDERHTVLPRRAATVPPCFYIRPGRRTESHANQSRTIRADGRPGGAAAHRQLAGVGGLSHHRRPPLQISVP